MSSPRSPRARAARGSVSVELALLTPPLVLVVLLITAALRIAVVHSELDAAARDAARAASLARSPTAAATGARTAAAATLQPRCQHHTVATDTSAFHPGGAVAVTVRCTISLADLALLRLPGTHTFTSRFTHPVDLHRGMSPS